MKIITIAGLGWLPIAILAAWWAGFAPFPTRPENVGIEQTSYQQRDTKYNDSVIEHFIPASEAVRQKEQHRGGCADTRTGDPELDASYKLTCWRVDSDVEFYGWGTPRWILEVQPYDPSPGARMQSITAWRLYPTYAACAWAKNRIDKEDLATRIESNRWALEHHQEVDNSSSLLYCKEMPK